MGSGDMYRYLTTCRCLRSTSIHMHNCVEGDVGVTLGFLVRVQNTISGPREGTRLCSSPNSGIGERFEDMDLDFELI